MTEKEYRKIMFDVQNKLISAERHLRNSRVIDAHDLIRDAIQLMPFISFGEYLDELSS